ncbi:MAG: outer membrane beta-barrel protein, partial [Gammaproteobacteria bacterium]|nr:outer membrane beta-barrel protein [Gammaproteobacteria bacterium]
NFSDIDYLQHAYGNQVFGRFDGLATLKLWTDHLNWIVRDDYGQAQLDPFAAVTPTNLERENVLTTGPDLTLRPTDASFVELEALYQRITYQKSPFDGESLTGSAAVGRRISALSKISLVGQEQQLRFDNTTRNKNFARRELYGDYDIIGARTAFDVQLGATQADDSGSWTTSPLARLSLSRKVSPFSAVNLGGGREYTDAAGAFSDLRGGAAGGIVVGGVTQTTANYLRNYASAGWAFSRLRTTAELTGRWERDTYDRTSDAIYNVTRTDAELSLGRNLTRRLVADIVGSYNRTQYANQHFTDQYGTVGAGLTWRPGRWVEVYARYDHSFRRPGGPQAAVGGGGYDENRVFVMLGYRPHGAADEAGGVPAAMGMPAPPP